jgi:hypothetical protein
MMYVVTNEFDELIRLVKASSPEEAIARAKADISPEALKEAGEHAVQGWRKTMQLWEDMIQRQNDHRQWCREHGIPEKPEILNNPYADFDPESCREIDLDEYNWQVLQEVDPEREVTVLEDLCL